MVRQYSLEDFLEAKSATGPSLSPSGTKIAYLANLTGTYQVYLTSAEPGGGITQLTGYDDTVSFVVFSPVSENEIFFGKDEGGNEKTQIYQLTISTGEIVRITDDPGSMNRFGGVSRDGRLLAYSSTKRNGTDFDVYVRDLETGEEKCTASPGGWCYSLGISPKKNYQVVAKVKSNFHDVDLFLIDLTRDAVPRQITRHDDPAVYFSIAWLPDESGFYACSNDGVETVSLRYFGLAAEVFAEVLSTEWDLEQISLTWDGRFLAVSMNEDGHSRLRVFAVDGTMRPLEVNGLPAGEITQFGWSQDGGTLSFVRHAYNSSSNVWVWRRGNDQASQLTAMPMRAPAEIMVEPELIRYKSFDGLRVPAYFYRPEIAGRGDAPVLVYVHGGPEGQYRPSYSPLLQYFAYCGYAVLAPNVRGSDGYGKSYLALDDREKRLDSVKDLESLHGWLVREGGLDAKRAVLWGASYGGYMVLAGLAFQPELWAAGVDIVGISNLVTFLQNTSSWRRSIREAEYGYLATDREFLEAASPFNKAGQIVAPLFIIHGANDPRVPLSEARQIYDSLAVRGAEVELLVYDDEGHGLSKVKNELDAYPKVVTFLDRVTGNRAGASR